MSNISKKELLRLALQNKNKSNGKMKLSELRKEIIRYFRVKDTDIIKRINSWDRQALKRNYAKKLQDKTDASKKTFRILVLCANDKTINSKESEPNIRSFLIALEDKNGKKIFKKFVVDTANYEYHYVNAVNQELKENMGKKNVHLVDVSNLNETVFKDNFFDIVLDEHCPINSDGGVFTKDTIKWVHRILKKSGYFLIDDFRDVGDHNRLDFYKDIENVLKIKDVDKLLAHIKQGYDRYMDEDLSEFLSKYRSEKNALKIILHYYLDAQIKVYREQELETVYGMFYINDVKLIDSELYFSSKQIFNFEELKKETDMIFSEYFDIKINNAKYNPRDIEKNKSYIVLKK